MINFKGFDDWIPIFQGGHQTDSAGCVHDGDALIDKALATFDASKHEPPVVIGHPVENAPAYGWVEGLKKQGDMLLAKFKQIEPSFADMVKRGLFKKRSAAFYPDGSLRHVGFLGAKPPAVKGLPDVAFVEVDAMTFEFSSSDEDKVAQEARSKKYGIAVKEGGHLTKPGEWKDLPDEEFLDPVNYRYPVPNADQTRAAAVYWARARNQAQYTPEERSKIEERLNKAKKKFGIGQSQKKEDKMTFKEFVQKLKDLVSNMEIDEGAPPAGRSFSEADIEKAKKEAAEAAAKAEREKVITEFNEKERQTRQEARRREISSWCESMVKEGKMTPAMVKFGVPEMLHAFAEREDVIEFGEMKDKATLYDRFKALFETEMPKVVEFKEVATRDKDTGGHGQAGSKVEALIKAKMHDNKELPYGLAFAEVQRENPDLVREYQQEIGG